MRIKMLFTLTVLALLYWACSDKAGDKLPSAPGQSLNGDPNVAFMISQLTATDSIDSSGTWYRGSDTLFWVMESDSGEYDTIPVLVSVRNDTAVVSGNVVLGLPVTVTITGTRSMGAGDSFPGSVWKVGRIAAPYPPDSLSALSPAGSPLFVYFSAGNRKVYTADVNNGLEKLGAGLILDCPYAFYLPVIQTILGYTVDKGDCDTIWVHKNNPYPPPVTLSGYIVGNPETLTLDVYTLPYRIKVFSYPIEF